MGKFDGILLCSDWDGTLSDSGNIPRSNIDAIRYFQREGGLFTFASGRYARHFKQYEADILPNTFLICVGGSCIMSREGEILYERFCNNRFAEYAKLLLSEQSPYQHMQITAHGHDPMDFDKKSILTPEAEKVLTLPCIYKCIAYTTDDTNADLEANMLRFLAPLRFEGYMPMRSWPYSVELIPENGGKGKAIRWLAEHLGAHLVVAVGDYENDCDMLKAADYGYAVTGGSHLTRASANRFAASVKSGAVASVIEELDREIS
jgi:Cof subfamily protein (haloacid dehalogenase superfamily)